jgi:hypothetical protein
MTTPESRWAALTAERDALAAELAEIIESRDAWKGLASNNQALEVRIRELEEALKGIAKLGGLTLLGGDGMEPDRAYQHGAHAAFEQAAGMASDALETGDDGG